MRTAAWFQSLQSPSGQVDSPSATPQPLPTWPGAQGGLSWLGSLKTLVLSSSGTETSLMTPDAVTRAPPQQVGGLTQSPSLQGNWHSRPEPRYLHQERQSAGS